MSVDFSGSVEYILRIIEEATTRNYPNHVLKYDLNKFLHELYKDQEDDFQEELKWAVESAEEEARDNCYEDAFDEGKDEGKYEGYTEFIHKLALKIIELKTKLRDEHLSIKDIQSSLTELLMELDDNDELSNTKFDAKLNELDSIL